MLTPHRWLRFRRPDAAGPADGVSIMSGIEDRLAQVKALVAGRPGSVMGGGIAGLLQRVCGTAVQTLSASGAGVSMMTDDGVRGVCAASDPGSERLEELQFTLGEGPCIDAFASRRPVLVPDLADGAMARWPVYAPTVHDSGVLAVFAFPLQVGGARLGGLIQERAIRRGEVLTEQLQGALNSRVVIEQAKGALAQAKGVSVDEAFASLRTYARNHNQRLTDVAHTIVAHPATADQLP
jgi:hypothetical protein